jgi:glutamate/tyrosine decarboxylase-like PLP-dependent enzyme
VATDRPFNPSEALAGESTDAPHPLPAWFLGPKAENAKTWQELINGVLDDYIHWRRNYFPGDPTVVSRGDMRSPEYEAWIDRFSAQLDLKLNDLKRHFPFHSPRYIAHMLSEQTLPAVVGYFAAMLYNPNNVTGEAAPITVELEIQVGQMVAEMLGYKPERAWAHLCSGGTLANLEALWVARAAQFTPLIVREYCEQHEVDFVIKTANQREAPIRSVDDRTLIGLRPHEAILMLRRLAHHIHQTTRRPAADILAELNEHVAASAYNIARRGLYAVLSRVRLRPVVFVSAAAHYSLAKAVNLLGYGDDALRSVPVTARFQMDTEKLEGMLQLLQPDEYVAAVVGIVGATEEGAVDPIHAICFARKRYEAAHNRSFWLHVDAAWGGYIRSLFCGLDVQHIPHGQDGQEQSSHLDAVCAAYVQALQIEERFTLDTGSESHAEKTVEIRWASKDVYAAFLAMPDADSITVDPHKLGYVPYPAGIIAFRNGLVTELIQQRAQYISDEQGGLKSLTDLPAIDTVGPYILEGSKPGAAALACWLAHRSIPLTANEHGRIVRATLLSAQKLYRYLVNHRHMFRKIHFELTGQKGDLPHPFTFAPFFEPDTNIVCFLVRPMMFAVGNRLEETDIALHWINRLNRAIYARASISDVKDERHMPTAQPFYVSRTAFAASQYAYASIQPVLARMKIACTREEYGQEGVFVLRSTVMNPWYARAEQAGMNYLYNFVKFLHRIAHEEMGQIYREMEAG